MRKSIAVLFGVAMLPLSVLAAAQALTYPDKPIRIVVPFPVGGVADTFGREIGRKLTEAWGQPVVIDNRAGAGGNIGADIVAKSAPDGYTLVIGNIGTHAVNVSLLPVMPFDPIKDFTPIIHVLDAEGLLVVNPSINAMTVPQLIALARAQPGAMSYGSAGIGTTSHLAGELFKSMTKVDIVHVPYKGNVPAITDLLGGQTSMIFATMPTVLPHVRAGKLRPLAVLGAARSPALPDVPTRPKSSGRRARRAPSGPSTARVDQDDRLAGLHPPGGSRSGPAREPDEAAGHPVPWSHRGSRRGRRGPRTRRSATRGAGPSGTPRVGMPAG